MPSSDATIRYFDQKAGELRRDRLVDKWTALAPLFAGVPDGATVAECGAGTGLYTLPLARAGYRVLAVDLSANSLSENQRAAQADDLAARVTTLAGDFAEVVRALDQPVDVVTFVKVLHHFPDHAAIEDAVRAGWSKLRPGGRIVLFEPNGHSPVWPIVFGLRGREVREAERNTRLMKYRFFDQLFRSLPGAHVRSGYRYLVPGTLATKARFLDRLDRATTQVPGLRAISGNFWFVVEHE